MSDYGPASARVYAWIATCGPCGITIGVRTGEDAQREADQIASEHNRIFHLYDYEPDHPHNTTQGDTDEQTR